jgi:hypothetical protein
MTMPDERSRAILQAREFLVRLAHGGVRSVPSHVRNEALRLLRHFPNENDVEILARRCPEWLGLPESPAER